MRLILGPCFALPYHQKCACAPYSFYIYKRPNDHRCAKRLYYKGYYTLI